jgi:transcriptional regulator with XRE-family HTH domain
MKENQLRNFRGFRGLSLRQLADKTGLYHQKLWRVEIGRQEPSSAERKTIARALQFSAAAIFPSAESKRKSRTEDA